MGAGTVGVCVCVCVGGGGGVRLSNTLCCPTHPGESKKILLVISCRASFDRLVYHSEG